MDLELIRELMNHGLATFLVVAGFLFVAIVIWKQLPSLHEWFADERKERFHRIEAMERNTQTLSAQSPLIQDTAEIVSRIDQRQSDPESKVSNVHPIEKLDALLRNDSRAAAAGIAAMDALIEHHPDLKARLEPAIHALREVEKDA